MMSEHIAFIANVNVQAANHFRDECFNRIKSLEEMPYRCPVIRELNFPYKKYRYLLFKTYALMFTVDEEEQRVYVDYIIDTREDYRWLVNDR